MAPELQRLHTELIEVRKAIAAIDDSSRLATNGWTVAQVLDHLAKIHEEMVPRFANALSQAPAKSGSALPRYSLLDRQLIRVMGGQSFKLPVPPMFEPGLAGPEAKEICLASIDSLIEVIQVADTKDLTGVKVTSPVSDRIRLSLLAYLDATVQHARYHRGQI